jgi:hypothetical protein
MCFIDRIIIPPPTRIPRGRKIIIDIQSEDEFEWAGELRSDGPAENPETVQTDDKYTVTGLGDDIDEKDKLENVIQANQNDPDPSDEYAVTGLGDDIAEKDKLENIIEINNREGKQESRSVTDDPSEETASRNDRNTDRERGRR